VQGVAAGEMRALLRQRPGRTVRWGREGPKVRRLLQSACDDTLRAYERDGMFVPDTLAALTTAMPPTRVSITQLSMAACQASPRQSLLNAVFIHAELIARRAAMLQQLERMPKELADSVGVQELTAKYRRRLTNLLRVPKLRTFEDEEAFASLMQEAQPEQLGETRRAFGDSLAQMAATYEGQRIPRDLQAVLDRHIDRIFLSRVGIRFLVKHYLASRAPPVEGFTGIIQKECCPVSICHAQAAAVKTDLRNRFGAAPPIEVRSGDRSQTFTFVPEHIKFVVAELLRNSCRLTLLRHAAVTATGRDELPGSAAADAPGGAMLAGRGVAVLSSEDEARLPAVRVVVTASGSSVTIKVADEAGGLARSQLADIWSYNGPRLQGGTGMGLPLARLYAMYFGGSLQLLGMEGYGTDAYATFNRLGDAQSEHCLNAPVVSWEDGQL